jgi:O6-methylguanine-DNA--protein-cysteine methyltransferase
MSSTPNRSSGGKKGAGSGPTSGNTQGDFLGTKDKSPRHNLDQRLVNGIITQAEYAKGIDIINQEQNQEKLIKKMAVLEKKREVGEVPLKAFPYRVEKALNKLCKETHGLITYRMIAAELGNPNLALAVANAMTIIWHYYYIF